MDKLIDPEKSIKAHSSAIQITHKLTLVQHKVWLVLLRNAYHQLPDNQVKKHTIRLSDLTVYLGYESNRNDRYLKNLLKALVETKVSWNVLGKDGAGDDEWGVASLLAGCKVKKGVVEYDYSTFLREKFYNPKMFALLNISILNKFRSKYSLAIYNLCKDYIGVHQTPMIPLDKFRVFMGLEPHEYFDFKSMNRRVIKEPVKEVNEVSDIIVTVEYKKERRRVVGIKFFIQENPQLTLDIDSITKKVLTAPDADSTDLLARLKTFGITEKQSEALLEKYEAGYISGNLDVVEKSALAGKVENIAPYTITALKEDYRPQRSLVAEEVIEIETGKVARKESALRQKLFESLLADLEIAQLENQIEKLSLKKRRALEESFVADEVEKTRFLQDRYQKEQLENRVVKAAFNFYVKGKMAISPPTVKQIRTHLAEQGHDPEAFADEILSFMSGQ